MNKFLSIALLAGVVTTAAYADVTIRITGSTAFRGLVFNALNTVNTDGTKPGFFDAGFAAFPTSVTGSANQFTFKGKKSALFGTQDVIVECAFSGSVEGLVNVLQTTSSSPVPQPAFLLPTATSTPDTTTTQADFAFSDVAQDTTLFPAKTFGTALEFTGSTNGFEGSGVGIVTFAWVKNTQAPTLSNVTAPELRVLLNNGSLPLGYFTGDTNATAPVYVTGRYEFSGTRLVAQADAGFGANTSSTLIWNDGGSANTFDQATPVYNGTGYAGTSYSTVGYIGGGDVRKAIADSAFPDALIGYLGLGDVNGTVTKLNYNGVAFSRTAVSTGTYSMWSSERIYGNKQGVSANAKLFMNGGNANSLIGKYYIGNGFIGALNSQLLKDVNYLSISEMKAVRGTDGGTVSPNF